MTEPLQTAIRDVPRIDLVYDRDCPNVERARSVIRTALQESETVMLLAEWDREDPAMPAEYRRYGSPTILVNGRDVGCDENAGAQSDANSCRVYLDDAGRLCGVPSLQLIIDAIRETRKQ